MLLGKKRKSGNMPEILHFVGIGGIGMSGIAEIMHNLGYSVQGSDLSENYNTKRLENLGIKVFKGHSKKNIEKASILVSSTAVSQGNPEVTEALAKGIPVIRRAEMLAELMRMKKSVAVSGSHGKTTTTSLVACLFEAAGLEPTVINGGIINHRATNAYLGSGEYLVAEADESDATFIRIPATIAVVTNVDPEHLDFYKDFASLKEAFRRFITNLPFYGFAVACADHPTVREIISDIKERKVIKYGIDSPEAQVRAFNLICDVDSSTFDVKIESPSEGAVLIEKVRIPIAGRHNVLNALAAITIAAELDFGIKTIKNGFASFGGVKRRFTKICEYKGASIIDDYAHHPVEIEATLSTARLVKEKNPGRVIIIFQPHRYSRLKALFTEFAQSLSSADEIYITEVYGAGETPLDGISGKSLAKEISEKYGKKASFMDSLENLDLSVKEISRPGDLIIMAGAGSISSFAGTLPKKLNIKESLVG